MTRAGAADTSTEPSTSQAEGAKREGEPIPTGPPSSVARGKSDGTSVTTTETHEKTNAFASRSVDRDANAEDGGADPLNASQKKMTKTKMGTNLYDVSWSLEEQNTLEDGLLTYAEGAYDSLWRYVKMPRTAKGVRDVALRVRWMKRKRAGEKTGAKRQRAAQRRGRERRGRGREAPAPRRRGPRRKRKAGEKGAGAGLGRAGRTEPGRSGRRERHQGFGSTALGVLYAHARKRGGAE